MVVQVTRMMGSSSDDWIYWHFQLQPLLIAFTYRQYGAIADLHHLQYTVAHALGFFLFTSRLLAMDLNTETTTVSHSKYYTCVRPSNHTSVLHRLTSFSSVLLVPIRSLVRVLLPQLLFTRNYIHSPHLELNSASLINLSELVILGISLYSRGMDHTENTATIVETCLPTADFIENSLFIVAQCTVF
jgi:hypothetical protein